MISFFLFVIQIYANDAYVKTAGAAVLPFDRQKNEQIQMIEEQINITLYDDFYEVGVKFYFKNHGDAVQITVGFPQWRHLQPTDDDFYDFETYVNCKAIPYRAITLETPEHLTEYLVITKWYVRDIVFPENETTTTSVKYAVPYGVYGISRSVNYLFGTGATWKDSIGKMSITIDNRSSNWINDIQIDGIQNFYIQRDNEKITIALQNVKTDIQNSINLTIDPVPKGLASLRRINLEEDWYYKNEVIKKESLQLLTNDQLRLLRNLLFAAHGNIFKSTDINNWLTEHCHEWYTPIKEVSENDFSQTERQNLKLIQEEENRR